MSLCNFDFFLRKVASIENSRIFHFVLVDAKKSYALKQIYSIFQPWRLAMLKESANVTWTLRTNIHLERREIKIKGQTLLPQKSTQQKHF